MDHAYILKRVYDGTFQQIDIATGILVGCDLRIDCIFDLGIESHLLEGVT